MEILKGMSAEHEISWSYRIYSTDFKQYRPHIVFSKKWKVKVIFFQNKKTVLFSIVIILIILGIHVESYLEHGLVLAMRTGILS